MNSPIITGVSGQAIFTLVSVCLSLPASVFADWLKARVSRRSRNLLTSVTGGETDHLNLLSNLSASSLHPTLPSPLYFSLQIFKLKMGEASRRLSNTAGSEFSLSSSRYSSRLWWISTEAAEPGQQHWQAARVGRRRKEQQIDRWHFTSAGGSTESRVSPKSSWGGTSFRPQGPPRKPPPLFRKNKRGRQGEGFREHLSLRILATSLLIAKKKKSQVFSPS